MEPNPKTTTPEAAYEDAFQRLQDTLQKLLTSEARLTLASHLRDLGGAAARLDRHMARGIVFVASALEHNVREDHPSIPEEPEPLWKPLNTQEERHQKPSKKRIHTQEDLQRMADLRSQFRSKKK